MIYAGLVFAGLAALLHVYIFVMESLTWTSARTRAAFGTTEEEAETTKLLAFNQGFYNLFLAIVTVVGIVIGGFGYYDAAPCTHLRRDRVDAGSGGGAVRVGARQSARGHHAGDFPAHRDRAHGGGTGDVASQQ